MSDATPLDRLVLSPAPVAAAAEAVAAGTPGGELALARPGWPFVLAAMARSGGRALLAVTPGDDEARDLAQELTALIGRGAVALWPTRGVPSGGAVGASPHLVGLRARAHASLGRAGNVIVASAAALSERVPADQPAEPFGVSVGEVVSLDALVDRLAAMGYEHVDQVEERGDMSVRGGILDIYPSTAELPARIELFGDEVESMRAFSAFTQRTIRPITKLVAWPAAEGDGDMADPLAAAGGQPAGRSSTSHPGAATALRAVGPAGLAATSVVRLAPGEHAGALAEALERLEDEAAAGAMADPAAVQAGLAALAVLDLAPPRGAGPAAFDAAEPRFTARSASESEGELQRLTRGGLRALVTFGRRGDLARALARMERLRATELDPGEIPEPRAIGMSVTPVRTGMISRELGIAVVPEERILRRRRPSPQRGPVVGRRLQSFLDLKVGDHVVHEDHGIGRLTGFETRTVAGLTRDYLALAFADGDRLYVPHDQLTA